jgi:PAS domain S-box-containing protein
MLAVFLAAAVVSMLVALVAVRNIRQSTTSSDWVNHTHAVILEGDAIVSHLHAGEAALRNYLITGDPRDQEAYRAAYGEMIEHVEVAKALTRNEPSPNRQFVQIESLLSQRVDLARQLAQTFEKEGLDGVRRKQAAQTGSDVLRQIQYAVNRQKEDQNKLLGQRDKESFVQAQATRWTVISGVGVNFLLLAFVGWLLRDDLAARRRATVALEEANAQLEAKVQQRTSDLAQANQTLKKENLERRWSNQALIHQLNYSDLIINSIGELVVVISKAENVSRLNPAVLRATAYDSPELVGSPLAKVLMVANEAASPSSSGQLSLPQALREGREIQNASGSLRRKDGQTLPIRFNLVPLRDSNRVVGALLTAHLNPDRGRPAA